MTRADAKDAFASLTEDEKKVYKDGDTIIFKMPRTVLKTISTYCMFSLALFSVRCTAFQDRFNEKMEEFNAKLSEYSAQAAVAAVCAGTIENNILVFKLNLF